MPKNLDILQTIGIVAIFIGLFLLLASFPLIQHSIYTPIGISFDKVSPINETRIAISIIFIIIGIALYNHRRILGR